MLKFDENQSLSQFQDFVNKIYGLPDDRLYSIWDLLTQQQRFAMRALKGIRKGDKEKLKTNLLISFSWLMAIANRLHIDLEEEVWRRFPAMCSYCGSSSCFCKKIKPSERQKVKIDSSLKPQNLIQSQKMFSVIYPPEGRTLAEAGVHLAEEMGEVSEAIHNFLGQHIQKQFDEIKLEMADYVSCVMGIANSAEINVARELSKIFYENCHICHKLPCACNFNSVASIKT
ncbi:hypothetical protein A2995_00440 [Candidatus Nomurabacteria bacterium RIFCSPLOWO2_01_FULL_33_24]|uniref:NTP pyrophosphohydrolase MazG-like domain-containing protein n=1 Tax=Candidatus Nomurabacteria bacterium RIFCSPLOWO2_01_FULL_33_24 TaxID=1801765 RepID=A0A1F6WZ21_9BACT|nr:MAG: hypothetical protein A2995_00440 [Candidatus Nomurabacteria bacterium RIFCSPLOWO2_01_FULL_33_24]